MTDFTVILGGSVNLLQPNTDVAKAWVEENIGQDNGYQPYYPTVVVEPRYLDPIIEGIEVEGLTVEA